MTVAARLVTLTASIVGGDQVTAAVVDWGDSNVEPLIVPLGATLQTTHVYAVGDYTIRVQLTSASGGEVFHDEPVSVVNGLPAVSMGTATVVGRTARVLVDASDDTGIASLQLKWDDGVIDDVNAGATVEHVYAAPGRFQLTLIATDDDGALNSTSQLVIIDNALPLVGPLVPSSSGVTVTLPVAPTDADGEVVSVLVDWGDGVSEELPFTSGVTAEHAYGIPGTQVITVRVIDNDGGSSGTSTVNVTSGVPSDEVLRIGFDGNTTSQAGPNLQTGNQPFFASDRFGFGSRAADFHKNNDGAVSPLLSISDGAIAAGASITFSVWLERRSQTPLVDRVVGVGNWFALFVDDIDAGAVRFGRTDGIRTAAEGAVRDAFMPVEGSGWQHYVGVVERLSASQFALRLYRNGVLRGEQVINSAMPTRPNCRVYVGRFPSGNLCTSTTVDDTSNNLPLNLDDVRVYNRALVDVEVQALFHERGFAG